MKYYKVSTLEDNNNLIIKTKKFLFKMIKKEYGYGYTPEYHEDIINLEKTYLNRKRNSFFIAQDEDDNIIGTIAIREYDKKFEELKGIYCRNSTASIWRVFVDENYRRFGIASTLVNEAEKFSIEQRYDKLYLHTHKNVSGALEFWRSLNYHITIDTNNDLKTVHMEKSIYNALSSKSNDENKVIIIEEIQ